MGLGAGWWRLLSGLWLRRLVAVEGITFRLLCYAAAADLPPRPEHPALNQRLWCVSHSCLFTFGPHGGKPPPHSTSHLSRHVLPVPKGNSDTFFSFFFFGNREALYASLCVLDSLSRRLDSQEQKIEEGGKHTYKYIFCKWKKKVKRGKEWSARIARRRRRWDVRSRSCQAVRSSCMAAECVSTNGGRFRHCFGVINEGGVRGGSFARWREKETRVKTARQGKLRRGLITNAHTHRQEKLWMKFQSCYVCCNGTINKPVSCQCGHQKPSKSESDLEFSWQ